MMNITALETSENRGRVEISFNIIHIINIFVAVVVLPSSDIASVPWTLAHRGRSAYLYLIAPGGFFFWLGPSLLDL